MKKYYGVAFKTTFDGWQIVYSIHLTHDKGVARQNRLERIGKKLFPANRYKVVVLTMKA